MNPILAVSQVNKSYGKIAAVRNISFDLYPGQVLGIVGESGSGKSTLLNTISGHFPLDSGEVTYINRENKTIDLPSLHESQRQYLMRTEWGFVRQNPRDGLRMNVTAGANISERLMDIGVRHYGQLRSQAIRWLKEVEIDPKWLDSPPLHFSGGMQQRLQLARVLVTHPRLILMDEPTGGLDVSVQAKLLDLLRCLVRNYQLSVILVTHDIGVVRLLAHRLLVMKNGEIVEAGLTDRVLDDPQHYYTQQLVSATLTP